MWPITISFLIHRLQNPQSLVCYRYLTLPYHQQKAKAKADPTVQMPQTSLRQGRRSKSYHLTTTNTEYRPMEQRKLR